jgi:O-antigen ligase
VLAGGKLYDRFAALSGDSTTDQGAEGSYEARKYLMQRALEGIESYPILGIGMNNFVSYSGIWHEVHMTYLQAAVEGGIPVFILFLIFFYHGFRNLGILLHTKNLDEETTLFVGALHASLIGFAVGATFAPEAFQFFPYFAVAFTAALLKTVREQEQQDSPAAAPPPKRGRHFLEVYADHGRTGAIPTVR